MLKLSEAYTKKWVQMGESEKERKKVRDMLNKQTDNKQALTWG